MSYRYIPTELWAEILPYVSDYVLSRMAPFLSERLCVLACAQRFHARRLSKKYDTWRALLSNKLSNVCFICEQSGTRKVLDHPVTGLPAHPVCFADKFVSQYLTALASYPTITKNVDTMIARLHGELGRPITVHQIIPFEAGMTMIHRWRASARDAAKRRVRMLVPFRSPHHRTAFHGCCYSESGNYMLFTDVVHVLRAFAPLAQNKS